MTREFENMLYLFGCGATGKEIDPRYCHNLSKIRQLALKQEAWDVVYAAVREGVVKGQIQIPDDKFLQLESIFTANIAKNLQRVEFNLLTVKKLLEQGIRCCVLKGSVVAAFYAVPEVRISSDTDILIDLKDEEAVCEILKQLGYSLEERAKYDHHRKAYHKTGGLLEVHINLHSEATREFILDDEIRYEEEYMLLENGVYSLGVNDGLFYLSAHLIKHFINDGAGIRQMMDLLLYMKAYDDKIDWDKYNNIMKKLKYDRLIAVVKGIGVKYFGMSFVDAITQGSGFEELLDDIEIGGLFGCSEKDRKQFYYIYTQQRSKSSNLEHSLYRLTKSEKSTVSLLFPSYKSMKKRFRYVEKCPILLPVAWIHRIAKITLKQLGILKNEEAAVTALNQRRIKMIEKLGMIKE